MAAGELLDRLSILGIKSERFRDPHKREQVARERETLQRAREERLPTSSEADELERQLKEINERLWDVEGRLRQCERAGQFGEAFIGLARSVYQLNDRRGELKRRISEVLGSPWAEQKEYGGE